VSVAIVLSCCAPAAAPAAPRCGVKGAYTVAKGRSISMLRRGVNLYGCLRSSGRVTKLAQREDKDAVVDQAGQRHLQLNGRFVAFEDYLTGRDGATYYVDVWDLRGGHHLHHTPTGPTTLHGGGPGFAVYAGVGPTTRIRLTARGQVAWIARNDDQSDPGYRRLEVHKIDSAGAARLDVASSIDPQALWLTRTSVSWRRDGVTRTATISS